MNTNSVEHTPANGDEVTASVTPENNTSVDALEQVLAPPPAPTDFVGIISTMLSEAGHKRPADWTRLLNQDAHNLELIDDVRRFLINRVLRMALSEAPCTTLDIRYCLVDKGDVDAYLALVKSEVVPCMVKYDLPLAVN